MNNTPVLMFGLDGGTWSVLGPALEEGYMPGLKALCDRGTRGVLESIIPAVTPPAWAAFQTGKNPGKTGVCDFLKHMGRARFSPVNSTAITGSFLDRLSRNDIKVGSLNLPMTYPPRPVNGFLVSGFLTPYDAKVFTYPADLRKTLEARFPGFYIFNMSKAQDEIKESGDLLQSLVDDLELRRRVAVYLIEREHPRVLFAHFQALDLVQHAFWPSLDPGSPGHDPGRRREILERFYGRLDHAITEIGAAMEADAGTRPAILAVSDHGFQRHVKTFHLSRWMVAEGYSVATAKAGQESRVLAAVKRLDVLKLRRRLLPRSFRVRVPELLKRLEDLDTPIDPDASAAVSAGKSQEGVIYILARDRREELQAEIKRKLLALRDPGTGNAIVAKVHYPEEIYRGERLAEMPDLVVVPVDGYSCTGIFSAGRDLIEAVVPGRDLHAGKHHPDGVYMAAGPGIVSGPGARASLMDVVPTLYYYLGLPVERDLDGVVRTAWFTEDFIGSHEVTYCDPAAPGPSAQMEELSRDEQEQIKQRLRDLGYL